jgi:calcineurin-like phosphoesterase family protein
MVNVFFTSDTHFYHNNIIKYVKRPFKNASEMNEILIYNWNKVVQPEDIVYHLGDFGYGKNATLENNATIARRLVGSIRFIYGNHDRDAPIDCFESAKYYSEIKVQNQEIILFHYGLRTWHHDLRGTWHLYGHSHGGLPAYGKSMDVGVDAWNFTPVSFADVKTKMDLLAIGKHPGFHNFKSNLEEEEV